MAAPRVTSWHRVTAMSMPWVLASVITLAISGCGAAQSSQTQRPDPPAPATQSAQSATKVFDLGRLAHWRTVTVESCDDIGGRTKPGAENVVVEVGVLDASCLSKPSREYVTVIHARYQETAPLGGAWAIQTKPWRTIDGHQVRRLYGGPLAEMSSRAVEAAVCAECGRVVVVMGPSPSQVRQILASLA